MIIFNLGSLLVALATGFICASLSKVAPDLIPVIYEDIFAMFVFFLSAVLIELIGLKPRIFYIPCWILGIIFMAIRAYILWGWPSLIGTVIVFAIAIKSLLIIGEKLEKKKWAQVQVDYQNYKLHKRNKSEEESRKFIFNCFFHNIQINNTCRILRHNNLVLKSILEDYSELFLEEDIERIKIFIEQTTEMIRKRSLKWQDDSMLSEMEELLSKKLCK